MTTTRRRRTLAEEMADDGTPHVAATAGTAPAGAIGGDQVLDAARNRAETGQTAPTPVPEGYGEVTGTGIETTGDVGATMPEAPTILDGGEGTGGGGTTYSDDATVGAEGEEGATGEMAPYQSMDDLFEQYARDSFGEVDTSEEEAQMQAQQDRLLGRGLVDTRARMGEAGFAAGGLDVALENTARAEAAEQLGLDISNIRDREGEQRRGAIEGAMGIDLDKQSGARQDAILKAQMDALNRLMQEGGEAGAPRSTTVTDVTTGDDVNVEEQRGEGFAHTVDDAVAGGDMKYANSVEDDWEQVGTDVNGNTIWKAPDGQVYKVPKGRE